MPRSIRDERTYAPRGMRREDAARYVGISTTKFDELVKDGRMPEPKRVDGMVIWDRYQLDAAFDALSEPPMENPWDRLTNDPLPQPATTHERMRSLNPQATARKRGAGGRPHHVPDSEAEKYRAMGAIVYADGEWEQLVRDSPMGKRELRALEGYFSAKGHSSRVKGAGWAISGRLEARGFIAPIEGIGHQTIYGITPAGETEWLRLSPRK